jgi:hypothetical protein
MTKVPGWTVAIAAIFGVLGIAVSLLIFLDPASAPVTSELEITQQLEPLVGSYAIRNSITAFVLLLAAWIRTPGALFAAVSGRLITELLDAARVIAAGAGSGLILVAVLIVPAVLVLWKLWPLLQIEMATARSQSS